MHIGLIGGIGPASTTFYYRALVDLYAQAQRRLDLTIENAEVGELMANLQAGDRGAQVAIFARYIERLEAAGCQAVALTSLAAHFCMADLASVVKLPLISALTALEAYFPANGIKRVGILGTQTVMESRLYGISAVEAVSVPPEEVRAVHTQYAAMAAAGKATDEQREFFETQASRLIDVHGAEAVVLGGTDLFMAFNKSNYPYRLVNCARIHVEEIARVGFR